MQIFNRQYNTFTISHSFTDSPFVTVQLMINNKNYLNWNDALITQLNIPELHASMPRWCTENQTSTETASDGLLTAATVLQNVESTKTCREVDEDNSKRTSSTMLSLPRFTSSSLQIRSMRLAPIELIGSSPEYDNDNLDRLDLVRWNLTIKWKCGEKINSQPILLTIDT